MSLSVGTSFTIAADDQNQVSVSALDATNIICGYTEGGFQGTYSVVIQSDKTVGSAFAHAAAGDGEGVTVAALSATKAILVYTEGATNDVRAVILNISGTTITTPGAELVLPFNAASTKMDIVALSSTSAILAIGDAGSTDDGIGIYLTVSGNTITNESNVTFESAKIDTPRIAFVSSTKAVVVYREYDVDVSVKAAVLSISGTTISAGTAIIVDSASDNTLSPTIAKVSSSTVLIAYRNFTDAQVKAVVLSISGTTLTENSAIVAVNFNSNRMSLGAYSATKFALSYLSSANENSAVELTVSGTTVSADTPILQNTGTGNFSMSSVGLTSTLVFNAHKGSLDGIFITLSAPALGLAPMTKPADVDAAGEYIYVALLNGGTPILTKISTALDADGVTVFDPGGGDNIGVECGRFNSDVVWVAGAFDGTNVVEKSEDGGSTFTVKDDATIGNVRAFVMGPDSDGRILVFDETNGDILETRDNGASWTNINASVTPEVNAIARLGQNVQESVFGNDGGANDSINYSVNSGDDLEDFQTGVFPNQNVTRVIVN